MSSEPSMISVSWPPLQVGEAGWRTRLEDLAARAESMVGRYCPLQATAEMGLELVGLIWPAISPEVILKTCQASLLLNQPVLMPSTPAEQCLDLAARLDEVYERAQSDPSAAVATVLPPLLQRVQESQARPGRKRAGPEPAAPLEPEPEPEPEHAPLPPPQRPVKPLRPASERRAPRPAPVEPEPELPEPWRPSEPEPWPPMTDPLPVPITPAPPPPASWLSCGEVAELLTVTRATVASWRRDGRLGVRNVDWVKYGRSTYFAPVVIEQLEAGRIPAGLDQLVAEVQSL